MSDEDLIQSVVFTIAVASHRTLTDTRCARLLADL